MIKELELILASLEELGYFEE